MPEYKNADINFMIQREDLLLMMDVTKRRRNQALLGVLWVTGARPSELIELKKGDCGVNETSIAMDVVTKKKREGKWSLGKRTLEFKRPLPPKEDRIIEFLADYLKNCNEGKLFPISTRTVERIVLRAGNNGLRRFLCPYNFRHTRMTLLAQKGATLDELLHFKGSTDIKSVRTYLHARPFKVDL